MTMTETILKSNPASGRGGGRIGAVKSAPRSARDPLAYAAVLKMLG